jgi:hypothetical protein
MTTETPVIDRMKGYNEKGLSGMLDVAGDLVKRAAKLFDDCGNSAVPAAAKPALRKELELCLAEAEELIAAVRAKSGGG